MSNGIPVIVAELGKTDFLAKSLDDLRIIDNRFHNPRRSKTILETINTANGEWPENGPTMKILNELLGIEQFLWENRHESDEILQPKVWEAIKLSREISGGRQETNRSGKKSSALSVTVVYTGLVDCWFIKTSQRSLGPSQRNPWAKAKKSTAKVVDAQAPLELTIRDQDLVTLVETNMMGVDSVDATVDKEIVDEAQEENVDASVAEKVNEAVESDVASEVSEAKAELMIRDYVMVPDVVKAWVNELIFQQNGKIKLQMDAAKIERNEMEIRLRKEFEDKLKAIREEMLMNVSQISSEYTSEVEGVHEASKLNESVAESVINVSSETENINEDLVDNLQKEIVEEQAEEALIEEPSTSKVTKVVVMLKKVTKKRTRNSDSDSDEEPVSPVVRRSRRVKRVNVNYSSLTQGVFTNAFQQQKEEDLELERIRALKIAEDDRADLKRKVEEFQRGVKKNKAKVAMEVEKNLEEKVETEKEQISMESEQKSMGKIVPDEEFSASESECPASPESPRYEVIEPKVSENEECIG